MQGCFTCIDQSINTNILQLVFCCDIQHPGNNQLCVAVSGWSSPFVLPCSGCCYHSAVSGGSCSACSSASFLCGNQRSWGPSGFQGNGPAEACSETSSQMDWQGRQRHEKQLYQYIIISNKDNRHQDQTETLHTLQKHTHTHTHGADRKLQTRSTTCNKSTANRSRAHSSEQWH